MISKTRKHWRDSSHFWTGILSLAFLSSASTAHASDGVLEINHACASGGGCFASDAPGYPVTIAAGGSYRLTSNLIVPDENTTAIRLTASNSSIDLAGFAIVGPGVAGSGYGIQSVGAGRVRVSGGSVIGVGNVGVQGGAQSTVTGMLVENAGGDGINASNASMISRNRIVGSGGDGISAGGLGSMVRENVVSDSGGVGITAFNSSLVVRNVVQNSGSFGISSFQTFFELAYGNNLLTNNNGGSANPQVNPEVTNRNLGGNVCGDSLAACP